MKTKVFILIALVAMTMASCKNAIKEISQQAKQEFKDKHNYRDSEKWGKVITKDIADSTSFSNIQVNGNVDVHITQGNIASVKAYGNEKAIEEYQFMFNTDNDGCTIFVVNLKDFSWDATKENHNVNQNTPAITVYVTVPSLENITVYGAGDIDISKAFKQTNNLHVEINGAGDFYAKDLTLSRLLIMINGAGDVNIKKSECTGNVDFEVNGAGDIDVKTKCANASVIVNGAGDVDLNAKCNVLTAQCNGVGDIKLKGECNELRKSDGAVGGINSKDLKVNGKVEILK